MPPKKPPAKAAVASPRGAAPPAAAPSKGPRKSVAGPGIGAKPDLFAAFEGLVQMHPNEAKDRLTISDEETDAFNEILFQELNEHLELSEVEARVLVCEAERLDWSDVSFQESTDRQRLQAALLAKQSAVERRAVVVDAGLGARLARKKSRLDAELAAEEERLAREDSVVPPDAAKKALLADREKWLSQTQEVKELLETARSEEDIYEIKNPLKKIEAKKISEKRKELQDKRTALELRLKKLEEMEAKYQLREAKERERQRRCANLKVDMEIISGQKNALQKAVSLVLRRKQEQQNELLDEGLFRQMSMQQGDDFYNDLREHEEEVKRNVEEFRALHGPGPAPPKPPPKPQPKKRTSFTDNSGASDAVVTRFPPIKQASPRPADADQQTPSGKQLAAPPATSLRRSNSLRSGDSGSDYDLRSPNKDEAPE